MVISYGNIKNIDDMDIYLCKPTEERVACILATDKVFSACFNDLSTFTMNVHYGNHSESYYDLIETMKLLEVTGIGYFQITVAQEHEDGADKYKEITAESLQTVFKRFGIDIQNKTYCLYNTAAPTATLAQNQNDDTFIPSIVAELVSQVGVALDLNIVDTTPTVKYDEWTITYISDSLKYATGGTGICRTMDENVDFAYDLLVGKVEEAFGCVVSFDYMYKTIKFYDMTNIAQQKNAYLSFDNFTTDMQVEENADDIVTVLRCEGDGVDISLVNPTGAGYITDFSYYKDAVNHKWMSAELIAKLNAWEADIASNKSTYEGLVLSYRNALADIQIYETDLTNRTKIIQDMQVGRDKYAEAAASDPDTSLAHSVAIGETVDVGTKSLASTSDFYNSAFSASSVIMAYNTAPTWDSAQAKFVFSGSSYLGYASQAYNLGYYYFADGDASRSYCKLKAKYNTSTSTYDVIAFDRFVAYKYLGAFTTLQEKKAASIKSAMNAKQTIADGYALSMKTISNALNIASFFSDTPDLYKELKRYWIEGNYNDSSIAVHDTTTIAEQIDLANELLANGATELSKVCQPRFKLSIQGVNCFANEELRDIADTLNLGDVLVVERDENTKYYPVLLKITFNFDDPEQLQLDLGNSLRLDDWGYTMADMITSSAQTSRGVSSNWQEIIAFSNERSKMYDLIANPLDSALRAANKNMTNQNFTVDTTGILGRVITENQGVTDISDKQIRILNNMILFTRDNWETAAAAFGEITLPGTQQQAYGLVAEAIIGKLLMGESLYISNANSSIVLDGSGITITIAEYSSTSTYAIGDYCIYSGYVYICSTTISTPEAFNLLHWTLSSISSGSAYVFRADTRGNLTARGTIYSSAGQIGGFTIASSKLYSGKTSYSSNTNGVYLGTDGIGLGKQAFYVTSAGKLTANEAVIRGKVTANDFSVSNTLSAKNGVLTVECDADFQNKTLSAGTLNLETKANIAEIQGTSSLGGTTSSASIKITGTYSSESTSDGTVTLAFTYSDISNWSSTNGEYADMYIVSQYNDRYVSDKISIFVAPTAGARISSGTYRISGISFCGLSSSPVTDPSVDPSSGSQTVTKTVTASYTSGGTLNVLKITYGTTIAPTVTSGAPGFSSYLGSANYRWDTVYCLRVDQSSSRDTKDKIELLSDPYEKFFDNLKPRSFLMKSDESGRRHYGFIVDEVVAAAKDAGIDDCGLYSLMDAKDPYKNGSLSYSEFIALNTWEIQKLKARIDELEKYNLRG